MRSISVKTNTMNCLFTIVLGMACALPSHATHASCEMMLSQTTIDHGNVNLYEANPQRRTSGQFSLGKHMLTLNVVCAQPTRFALVFRGPTSSEKHGFSTNDGKAMFSIVLAQAQADGKPVTWTHSGDPNKNKQRIHLTPDKEVQPLTAGQVTVSPISRLTALVEIDTTMRAEDTTKLASDMVFSEQGTFHIVPS